MLWILYLLRLSFAQHTSRPYSNSSEAKGQSYDQIPGVYVPLPAQKECLLWVDTCSGNQTQAINQFFSQTRQFLYENVCFTADGDASVQSNCTRQNRPARYEEFERIKSWMRSPPCIASQDVYQKARPTADTEGMQGEKRHYERRDNSTQNRKYGGGTCCGTCIIKAGNVDVYYWPVSHANTSCLSIIGKKINPPDYGATTDSLGLK